MKKPTFSDYFAVLMKWRRFIIRNVLVVTVLAIIISLIVVWKYTATATILPPNPEQEAMFGFIPGMMAGGFTGAFSSVLSGMVPGVTTPSDLYATIMTSSGIKRRIIEKYNLMEEFKAKTMHDAFRALDDITKVEVSPEGIISVAVTYKNKYLSTDIANSYIEELDRFNTETAMTVGKKYRIFVEERLKENIDTLAEAEEALRNFQEKHRTVALDAEIQSAIETIAKLKSEIILREIQKGAMASGQVRNPYIYSIDKELKELKKQLEKIEFGTKEKNKKEFGAGFSVPFSQLPEVSLEYARLLRNVKVQEAIYELLTQQYEQAKIMELKDTPTVQFLDKARIPEKRTWPKRTLIVIFAFFLSLFANIPLVFLLEYLADIKSNPQNHSFAIRLASDLSKDTKDLKRFIKKILGRSKN